MSVLIKPKTVLFILCLLLLLTLKSAISQEHFPVPQIEFSPKKYICYRTNSMISIDGRPEEIAWTKAPWSDYFVDIEGPLKPKPYYKTRIKMLWDDEFFYFAAELEEPDVWAKLHKRDTVIFYDNDFEIFIDPDGDTHDYYEYEVNAFGTVWDLLLLMPYRDATYLNASTAVNSWDIQGLKSEVFVNGTINDPSDTDKSWSIEVAIPWEVLKEQANKATPPKNGDQWRVNFSRVQWKTEKTKNGYKKAIDPSTGKNYSENNWVWSPQGLVALHYPEMWGFVQFSEKEVGSEKESFVENKDEKIKWALRQVYYAQKEFYLQHKKYTSDYDKLKISQVKIDGFIWPPKIETTTLMFEAHALSKSGKTWIIRQDGKIWSMK